MKMFLGIILLLGSVTQASEVCSITDKTTQIYDATTNSATFNYKMVSLCTDSSANLTLTVPGTGPSDGELLYPQLVKKLIDLGYQFKSEKTFIKP